jgi:glutamate synthase domain-containing protein 3
MTGGVVVILGAIGPNMGAGMTGGRAYLWDPDGTRITCVDTASVRATRLRGVVATREDGTERVTEIRELLEAHRDAGSLMARQLLAGTAQLGDGFWLIEPVGAPVPLLGGEPETDAATVADAQAVAPAG